MSQVFPNAIGTPYKDVTLEQLVSHRGGVQPNPPNWWAYPQSGQPLIKQRQQAVQDALNSAPAGTPGVTYTYSNWGVMIAGAMLEVYFCCPSHIMFITKIDHQEIGPIPISL